MKKITTIKTAALLLSVFLQTILPVSAQQTAPGEINDKIRAEAMNNSQIMRSLHFLSDVYGPRL
jgi:hypothetical protein